ncbi:hypothetical protein [Anaeromusa acidaminophila]|uniref:hypothetical protein n=1 Tax=Anaeromusa acidaminophila TaxID=81464 RepID=UPI0012EAFF34|nr:hypothetical protein [Anaeromusa acidaminophila]
MKKMTMRNKIGWLLSMLVLLVFISGCGRNYAPVSMEKDLQTPVSLDKRPNSIPTLPENTYRMYLMRELIPLQKHGMILLQVKDSLERIDQRRPGVSHGLSSSQIQEDVEKMKVDAEKVATKVRELTPPPYEQQDHNGLVQLLDSYAAIFEENHWDAAQAAKAKRTIDKIISLQRDKTP